MKPSIENQDSVEFCMDRSPFYSSGHHACDLVDVTDSHKDGHMFNYTVMARHSDSEVLMIKDVPHAAITLVDLPYTSDIHTPGAFRQWIAIEDRLFPQAWRNMRE
jgi:hypothetical protein